MAVRKTKFDELKRKRSEGNVAHFSGAILKAKRRDGRSLNGSHMVTNGSGTTPPRRTSNSNVAVSNKEQTSTTTAVAAIPSVVSLPDAESSAPDAPSATDASGGRVSDAGGARAKQGMPTQKLAVQKVRYVILLLNLC